MNYFLDTEFLEGPQHKTFLGIPTGLTKPTIDLISIGLVAEDGREFYAISKDFNIKEAWGRYDLDHGSGDQRNHPPRKVYWIRENVLKPIFYELMEREVQLIYRAIELRTEYKTPYNPEFCLKSFKYLINKYGTSNQIISEDVRDFIGYVHSDGAITFRGEKPDLNTYSALPIEFYGYFCDYDWVVFCWLFGRMIDLPNGFPMYCRDLKQMFDESQLQYENHMIAIHSNNGKDTKSIEELRTNNKFFLLKDKLDFPKQENEHNALADAHWNKKLYDFILSLVIDNA